MVQFEDVSLAFDDTIVLQDFSFNVKAGEKICFSGASGKGKSSVLKMIQGYVLPGSGKVFVDGFALNPENIDSIRGKIAYVPQNVDLPVENASELLQLIGISSDEKLVKEYLKNLGLKSEMLKRLFSEMSGGQKQRVVVAVCLALDRNILLLDEPSASLDEKSTGLLIYLVHSLKNKTIISASHDQEWINAMEREIHLV